MKSKSMKWGFKFWMRCEATLGDVYEFDLHTGKDATT